MIIQELIENYTTCILKIYYNKQHIILSLGGVIKTMVMLLIAFQQKGKLIKIYSVLSSTLFTASGTVQLLAVSQSLNDCVR